MHTRTYVEKAIIKASRNFVCIHVDPNTSAEAQAVCDRWRIIVKRRGEKFDYPIAILLDRAGEVISTHFGFFEAPEFGGFLTSALEKAGGGTAEKPVKPVDEKPKPIAWEASYEDGMDTSSVSQKPMMMVFFTEGEPDGDRIARETLADAAVLRKAASFVCIKVNPTAEEESYIAESYEEDVKKAGAPFRFPLVIFVSPDLDTLAAKSGFFTAKELVALMDQVLKK